MQKILNQKGQILLIVVLAMVVALTVGLAVAARSITNLRNSQQEVDSQRALSAAETGVEQALRSGGNVGVSSSITSTTYNASVATVYGSSDFLLNGKNWISKDDAMYIWLSPYSKDPTQLFQDANRWPAGGNTGTLNLFWGNYQNGCSDAALEIDVVWNTRAYPRVARYAYDPCSPSRTSQNGFAAAAATNKSISNIPLYYTASISITNGFLVRVIPLYTDSYVGASSNPQTLPPREPSLPRLVRQPIIPFKDN